MKNWKNSRNGNGPQENIFAIPLLAEEDAVKFSDKFNNLTKDFDDFVVFADLFGGTHAMLLLT